MLLTRGAGEGREFWSRSRARLTFRAGQPPNGAAIYGQKVIAELVRARATAPSRPPEEVAADRSIGCRRPLRLCTAEGIISFGTVDAHIRRRIRALIVRQKKRYGFGIIDLGNGDRGAGRPATQCAPRIAPKSNGNAVGRGPRATRSSSRLLAPN
jgi:hypothetical protein